MARPLRTFLIVVAVLVLAVVVVVVAGFVAYIRFDKPEIERPAILAGVGVHGNALGLAPPERFAAPGVGVVSDFLFEESEFYIAGADGATSFAADRTVGEHRRFASSFGHVVFLHDVDGEWLGFLNRGSGWQPVSRLDRDGAPLWTIAHSVFAPNDLAVGDLDGDGRLDFVAGFNGGGGVSRFDGDGNEVWNRLDANVWQVEVLSANGEHPGRIVHSNAAGRITLRDAAGEVVERVAPGPYFSGFSLIAWPGARRGVALVSAESDRFWFHDLDGTVLAEYDAPGCGNLGVGRAVRLHLDGNDFIAALVDYGAWDGSLLHVYDADGTLVYRETREGPGAAIAAPPATVAPPGSFFVGGRDAVDLYSLPGAAPAEGPDAGVRVGGGPQ